MKIMKRTMLGFAMLVGAGAVSSTNAADIYSKGSLKDGPAEYMPAITWTGFYFGGHLGATFFDTDGKNRRKRHCDQQPPTLVDGEQVATERSGKDCDQETESSEKRDGRRHHNDSDGLDDTSWLGGIHLGYNWQRSNGLVFGVEGDVSFADEIDYLASFRGRLGFAHGSTLLYGTAGVAFIGLDDTFGDDDSSTGWVAGLGVEHKLRDNVSIGLEGLYYSFDDLDSFDDDLEFWTVRARLTYHFTDSHSDPLK
jgi:outer membrane immunogenic protein